MNRTTKAPPAVCAWCHMVWMKRPWMRAMSVFPLAEMKTRFLISSAASGRRIECLTNSRPIHPRFLVSFHSGEIDQNGIEQTKGSKREQGAAYRRLLYEPTAIYSYNYHESWFLLISSNLANVFGAPPFFKAWRISGKEYWVSMALSTRNLARRLASTESFASTKHGSELVIPSYKILPNSGLL